LTSRFPEFIITLTIVNNFYRREFVPRPTVFNPEYFTVYDMSRRLNISYARARKLILSMEKAKMIIRVIPQTQDTKRFRRYKIK